MAAALASCSVEPCLQQQCRGSLSSTQHQAGEALALCTSGLKWNVLVKEVSALTLKVLLHCLRQADLYQETLWAYINGLPFCECSSTRRNQLQHCAKMRYGIQ